MFDQEEILQLRKQLSKHYFDFRAQLAERSGLSKPTISKFLNGKTIHTRNQRLLYKTAVELIQESRDEKRALIQNSYNTTSRAA